MEFQTTVVALSDHPLQWVPIRRRRCTLTPCKELTPWLILTWIERITLSTHLKDDSIHTISLQFVQLITQRTLHLLCTNTLELSVHTLNPRTAELSLLSWDLSRHGICRPNEKHCGNQ